MSLSVYLTEVKPTTVWDRNITHNLWKMADEAGIYYHLWRPEEIGIFSAWQLIQPLREALRVLREDPERFKKFNAENGWGIYEDFIKFVEEYLRACEDNPKAEVKAER